MTGPAPGDLAARLTARHLRLGWWGLAVFVLLGLALETLHGFKVPLYLDVDHEARRLMWRLAHAHGVLLSLVQLGYAATLRASPRCAGELTSRSLTAALLLMPLGFLLGGVWIHGGDPGLGVLLVPPGGLLLLLGVVQTARRAGSGA